MQDSILIWLVKKTCSLTTAFFASETVVSYGTFVETGFIAVVATFFVAYFTVGIICNSVIGEDPE